MRRIENAMRRIGSWLWRLNWKWKALLGVILIVILAVVLTPSIYYLLRGRSAPDYSELVGLATMTFLVTYESGEDVANEATYTVKVADIDVIKDGVPCLHTVADIEEPLPVRKAHARLVGKTNVTLADDQYWRSQEDLQVLNAQSMQVNLPLVNTAITYRTYSQYENYPGWPYSLGDSWTYNVYNEPDTSLQPKWDDTWRAEVVDDDAVVVAGGVEYECFKVVHTLTDTTIGISGGGGIGSTRIEYWVNTGLSIAPIKIENTQTYIGLETWLMVDADPAPGSWQPGDL